MVNKKTPRTPAEAAQMLIDDPTFMTLGDPRWGVEIGTMRLRIADTFRITPLEQSVIFGKLDGGLPLLWGSTERDLLIATEANSGKVYAKIHWPCRRRRSRHTIDVFEHETIMLFQPFISKPVLRVAMGLKAWPGMR